MSETLKHKIEKFGREKVLEAFLKLQKQFAKDLKPLEEDNTEQVTENEQEQGSGKIPGT